MSHRREVDTLPWHELDENVGGRLVRVEPALGVCMVDGSSAACSALLRNHRNPFFNQDEPGAFQTTGWLDAYVAEASPYAVAATTVEDISAAVRFAREHGVPLVVKGTGHDYLGRSSAPDSLLVWTHNMREVTVHDAFEIAGSRSGTGVRAITVGAGTRWLEAYQAATRHGRYVQGGGCTSVGAAGGFTQGGGFGSFSKRFGTAAGNVVEIEVVTADGETLVVNENQHPDLFWALRGGGGGTFAVVSKMTMLTHEMPGSLGLLLGRITAISDAAYRRLIHEFVRFYAANLDNQHWGEQFHFAGDNSMELAMTVLDLSEGEARSVLGPFTKWIEERPGHYTADIGVTTAPFRFHWDHRWWDEKAPGFISHDDRPGQRPGQWWWTSNQGEVSQYLDGYQSRWLPIDLFEDPAATDFADALFEASRHWPVSIHANKGLSGAAHDAIERDRNTSINPAAFDAAALLIIASRQHAYPGVPGHQPDLAAGRANARSVGAAMEVIRAVTPGAGTYLNEADYFEPDWQRTFWGGNYPRLLAIKQAYDPANIFRVHHGVGSDAQEHAR